MVSHTYTILRLFFTGYDILCQSIKNPNLQYLPQQSFFLMKCFILCLYIRMALLLLYISARYFGSINLYQYSCLIVYLNFHPAVVRLVVIQSAQSCIYCLTILVFLLWVQPKIFSFISAVLPLEVITLYFMTGPFCWFSLWYLCPVLKLLCILTLSNLTVSVLCNGILTFWSI